jgi:hypothetical protein
MNNVAVDIGVEKPTKEEVEEVLKELGTVLRLFEIINYINYYMILIYFLINLIDENGDGKLSLDEF